MKVVLKADVKGTGKKDELVEVSPGFARNYLMPRGLAVEASAGALNEVQSKAAAKQHKADMELAAARDLAEKLDGKTVTVIAKAGQGGRLFGAVTAKDVAEKASELAGVEVDKRKVVLESDIKGYGSYTAELKVYSGITAKLYVVVKE